MLSILQKHGQGLWLVGLELSVLQLLLRRD